MKKKKEETVEMNMEVGNQEAPVQLSKEQMDAIVAKAEADALAKVCKAVGTNPEQLKQMEENQAKAQEQGEYNLGTIVCRINGVSYTGRGKAPRAVCEQLIAMASAKRKRLINEKIGRDAQVISNLSGGISYKILKKQDDAGLEMGEV